MKTDPLVIEFRGFCSKKNRKAPLPNGRGLYIEKRTREMLDRMEMQVPAMARDRMLDNPEVEWHFTFTNAGIDTDGIITTVLDILQKYRVIVNDNIAHFNGKKTIWPAVRGEYDSVTVILIPQAAPAEDAPPRYVDPRRRRVATGPSLELMKALGALLKDDPATLEDIPEEFGLWDE